jgi:hypothetical protein
MKTLGEEGISIGALILVVSACVKLAQHLGWLQPHQGLTVIRWGPMIAIVFMGVGMLLAGAFPVSGGYP